MLDGVKFEIVEFYACWSLTKESDRLLALSGVAKIFREAMRDVYLAGLWQRTIYCRALPLH